MPGTLKIKNGATWEEIIAGHLIEMGAVVQAREPTLNFTGAGVTITDNPGVALNIDIPGYTPPPTLVLQEEGVDAGPIEAKLNFVGGSVTVATTLGSGVSTVTVADPPVVTPAHVVANAGTALGHQPTLNFTGNLVATDNAAGTSTDVTVTLPAASTPGHAIEDESIGITPQRNILNFVGDGVAVTDDATNSKTVVTVMLPAPGAGPHVIAEDGTPLPVQPTLNFGTGLTAIDSTATNSTDVSLFLPAGTITAVAEEGTVINSEPTLNFIGAGVTAVDNFAASRIDVTIPGSAAGHVIADEGTPVTTVQPILNFVGPGVAVTDGTGETIVTVPGLAIAEEGTTVSTATTTSLNFVGTATAVANGTAVDVTVTGSPPLLIAEEGVNAAATQPARLNFVGASVLAVAAGADVNVTVSDPILVGTAAPTDPATLMWYDIS